MTRAEKIIRAADKAINWLILLCFLPLLLYGIYAIWDAAQINKGADVTQYTTYKPAEDELSFAELVKLNPEVFAWLSIEDTNIDYPLAQGKDNSKYVNINAKGEFALSGSLFLDYRNNKSFTDVNNIIYGHHMEKKAMFGELIEFDKDEYFDAHRYGKIYYEHKWRDVEFFAFIHADAYDAVLYNPDLQGETGRRTYLAYVKNNASVYREVQIEPGESYLTLSTCAQDSTNGRHILVGRIIKGI